MPQTHSQSSAQLTLDVSDDANAIIQAGISAVKQAPNGATSDENVVAAAVAKAIGQLSLRYVETRTSEVRTFDALREIAILYVRKKAHEVLSAG